MSVVDDEDGRWKDSGLHALSGTDVSEHGPERASGMEMDEQRKQHMAYEYLCHLEEAKIWMEACLKDELPPSTELEEAMRNGVILARLANFFAPEAVPYKRIFDKELKHYNSKGLHFRHTDNINFFFKASEKVGLPKVFYPETTDIYDKKNVPKLVYCIHALSLYLFKLGLAPQIQDLYGKATFTAILESPELNDILKKGILDKNTGANLADVICRVLRAECDYSLLEEEISAMSKELEKYGIQMPAFSKIGGILANEMPVDEAALHAAVIAINDAINHQVASVTLEALRNPNAHLVEINSDNSEEYQELLYNAKSIKSEIAFSKTPNKDDMDVYDTLLTQAEIQGNINKVNEDIRRRRAEEKLQQALNAIDEALESNEGSVLIAALSKDGAGLKGIDSQNSAWYLQMMRDKREEKRQETGNLSAKLNQNEVQEIIFSGNEKAERHRQMEAVVLAINRSIDEGSPAETLSLLQRPEAMLPTVYNRSAYLYHNGLKMGKIEKQESTEEGKQFLTHEDIVALTEVLSAIVLINTAIEKKNSDELIKEMQSEVSGLETVDETLSMRYLNHFVSVKQEKAQECGVERDDLTQMELQICVDYVNTTVQEEHDLIAAISVINEVIERGNADATLRALQVQAAKLSEVEEDNAALYQMVLAAGKASKAQKTNEDSVQLWHNEIQGHIFEVNDHARETKSMVDAVVEINRCFREGDKNELLAALQHPAAGLRGVTEECTEAYYLQLRAAEGEKELAGCNSPWLAQKTSGGYFYYFNVDTGNGTWIKPDDFDNNSRLLTREEIQAVISRETGNYDRWVYLESNEPMITKLQAHWKGYLARKSYKERILFMKEQLPAILKIQAHIRGFLQKLRYRKRLRELHSHEQEVIKLQSYARMYLAKKGYLERQKYFKDHQEAVIKIQAWLRANIMQSDYRKLISMQDPPVKTVRKFLHLLEHSDLDFEEELELQKLRAQVVTEIRSNQQLESDLNIMDIKIGLLVKNRISLEEVVHHNKKLKQEKSNMLSAAQYTKGIKSFSKESRETLEAYQNLFYLLQTNPTYLAKLIFAMPQSRTTKFMESVVLTLYNYASNAREEYLLLKLFETALKEEIICKVDQMQDIITGNPTVIKMVVHFNRGTRGQSSLKELLQPLVSDVLNDKNLAINTNPIELYKAWINQLESESGEASKLPYDVDIEQALQHAEVRAKMDGAMKSLKAATDKFLDSILTSADKLPYGLRFVAMTLRITLMEKFPDASSEEILKVVGNLIYYRYMNPAIVAPDAFDIVALSVDKALTPDQRRNLGSVAKLLQYAASNKMFGGENAHLSPLNSYITEAHKKFKAYFLEVSTVEEPESRFNIDEYTDVVMLTKPIIYITVQEVCDTHALLLEHREEIAGPDPNDPLHELLDDLGNAPSPESLLGISLGSSEDLGHGQALAQSAKTEISLTLTNKFELPEDDDSDMRALFVRTKRMIVDVLKVQPGETLTEILETPATEEQEDEHMELVKKRAEREEKKEKEQNMRRSASVYGDSRLPLEGVKRKVIRSLRILESQGLVSIKNNYQDTINAIAKDIRNQRRYRQRRRQERRKLGQTLESLQAKSQFFEEQIGYYNKYIAVCLDNLAKKGKKKPAKTKGQKEEVYKGDVKYTAQKLYEKGVVLEIEGLPQAQFKNVMFEIKSGDEIGLFEVSAKFMGVAMEKVELVFQDLLQLQYEGVAVMKMFGRAKINVNLLIFLLNKKFYGK